MTLERGATNGEQTEAVVAAAEGPEPEATPAADGSEAAMAGRYRKIGLL
jgi:hypothetical protein